MARRKQHNRRSDCDRDTWLWLEESNITDDLIVMGTTRLWLEESNIADDLIVMGTTRLWLEESNITDDLIVIGTHGCG